MPVDPISPDASIRRRRPSGEPAVLPRQTLAGSGKVWIALAVGVGVVFAMLISSTTFFLGTGSWWDAHDQRLIGWVAGLRSDFATDVAQAVNSLNNEWFLRILRWATIAVLILFKRWRHLFVLVGVLLVMQPLATALTLRLARPRPDGIEILAPWSGFALPSLPIMALTMTLVAIAYAVVTQGRHRRITLLAISAVVVAIGLSRFYLGVENLTDGFTGAVIGVTVPLVAFRIWTPDAVFPVSYGRRKAAHLELTDRRQEAILRALREQLGIEAESLELFGLEGSGGSTPIRVAVRGGGHVFAKVYAQNHLRSDRWYKWGRRILYGALEDEAPFRSVRRLAEHEDYVMRLMAAAGVPGPQPLGIAEMTPGREYLMVTEFIEGAAELSDVSVDTEVVHTGLRAVRSMWDAGLAHRDIKPANVLVRGSEIFLIDHAFGEVQPTPWRQAVDLANMMLALSLRSSPQRVHDAALEYFTAEEIAEAFAASRGVTVPGELRAALRDDGRDLIADHRALAPPRRPIRIQRFTPRRLGSVAIVTLSAVAAGWLLRVNLSFVGGLL